MCISYDHKYIGFGVDPENNEFAIFGIKDIEKNIFLRERIENCANLKFGKNGNFFYVKHDDKHWTN